MFDNSQPTNCGGRAIQECRRSLDKRLAGVDQRVQVRLVPQSPQGWELCAQRKRLTRELGLWADAAKLYSRTRTPGSSLTRSLSTGSHLAAIHSIAKRARTSGKSSHILANSLSSGVCGDMRCPGKGIIPWKHCITFSLNGTCSFEQIKAFSGRSSRVCVQPGHDAAVSCERRPARVVEQFTKRHARDIGRAGVVFVRHAPEAVLRWENQKHCDPRRGMMEHHQAVVAGQKAKILRQAPSITLRMFNSSASSRISCDAAQSATRAAITAELVDGFASADGWQSTETPCLAVCARFSDTYR